MIGRESDPADRLLSALDQENLGRDFERVEEQEIGAGVHQRYQQLAEEMVAELNHPRCHRP